MGPPTPGPTNIWGNGSQAWGAWSGIVALPQTAREPRRATSGSAGLDFHATARLVLTPWMGIQLVETDFQGPLAQGTVGLLIGRSSSTLKGLRVHPGVIDPDYEGIIKVMAEAPKGIVTISPGDRIAQLVILPSLHDWFPAVACERGDKGFGSLGGNSAIL
ncbi:uncharacterized protein LOC105741326 [Octodon degus]|uniref:Uncharacterized protein LOC105741326 n=1 Tax=Octodon degus TaxID=10160 RepID=A0A6P3V9N1_OCTDE|nr:uncharacterized protein LOC105741326 [Octodon degus]